MKLKTLLTTISIVAIIGVAISLKHINALQKENNRLYNNQKVLLDSVKSYKIADSLNVAQVGILKLSLDEYKRYRSDDIKLISQLKTKLSNVTGVTTTATKTEYKIKTQLKDSIVHDTIHINCFNYKSYWTDVEGCINKDTIQLHIENRESLKIVENIEYKRFLGFLWKTNKIKRQTIEVISENPNTVITNIECIQITK